MPNPKVTVYITNHNYGRFVAQAIESVLAQTFLDFELIVIDDGSTDGSHAVIRNYEHLPNVRGVYQKNHGLTVSSNIALRLSRGRYVIRLDADDYLDENALLVLSNVLDQRPDVGLVYPDYYRVDEEGQVLGIDRRNKVGQEITLYDIPAHGAGTMIRKECLLALGGYSEDLTCHDGYDLWVRFVEKYKVYNVNVPLFYYRQHPGSLSKDKKKILQARRMIKRRHATRRLRGTKLDVVGIVPARRGHRDEATYALREIAGRPMIDFTLEAALGSEALRQVVVVSEDEAVLNHVAAAFPAVLALKRPPELGRPNTPIAPTVRLALDNLAERGLGADAFALLYVNSPLRRAVHVRNAVDTMLIFDVDSVISVYEDLATHYQHVGSGLRSLFPRRELRLEKEALWVENGAIYLSRVQNLRTNNHLGESIGHIVMLRNESLQIDSEEDFLLVDYLLRRRGAGDGEAASSAGSAGHRPKGADGDGV